eukprot:14462210-Alexandrium_andersonii.AAC.1
MGLGGVPRAEYEAAAGPPPGPVPAGGPAPQPRPALLVDHRPAEVLDNDGLHARLQATLRARPQVAEAWGGTSLRT